MVKQQYFNDVKFSKYSKWHREQHNLLNFSDIDQVSSCNACLLPLFLVETVFFNNQKLIKPHKITKKLAEMAGIPAFILWYHCTGDMMMWFHVKKIAPNYPGGYSSEPRRISPDHWLEYLEFKQAEHFPKCSKQDLFQKKLKEDPRARIKKAYASILFK